MLAEGIVAPDDLHEAPPASWDDLRLVHTPDYVDAVASGTLPRDDPAADRLSVVAADGRALAPIGRRDDRRRATPRSTTACAANLAGGTHHAFADRGEGYCVFNDVAVARARAAARSAAPRRIAIVDLRRAPGQRHRRHLRGDAVGVHVLDARREELPVQEGSQRSRRRARRWHRRRRSIWRCCGSICDDVLNRHQPDFVFYLAGADPYEGDRLGRLKLTIDGLRRARRARAGARAAAAACRSRSR